MKNFMFKEQEAKSAEKVDIMESAIEDAGRFLRAFCWLGIILALSILFFNAIVDPFGLIGVPVFKGVNEIKPRMFFNSRMVKAHQISRFKPHGLILGSSRAETGIDPEHPGWSKNSWPVYNASLPSARIFELYQYLRHAQSEASLSQVVIGLDFFSFDAGRTSEPGFETSRLNTQHSVLVNFQMVKDIMTGLLSYDALSASFDTLNGQGEITFGYLNNGSQDTRRRREMIKAKGGHFAAFESSLKSIISDDDGIAKLDYGHDTGEKINSLGWFRELVRFCIKERIELYVLISPVHSQWLEMIWQLGAWNDYEQWKRDITQIVEIEATEAGVDTPVEIWDFSGFNNISMEQVPKPEDASQEMKWYWEASHYKRETGNLMLDKALLGIKGEAIPGFGSRLTMEGIESHLRSIGEERQKYEKEKPEELEYLKKLILKTLNETHG